MKLHVFFILLCVACFARTGAAQFGYGMTGSIDLYQRYVNPSSAQQEGSLSAGSAVMNLGLGPKVWLGNKKISFSAEAQAVLGMFTYSYGDYKGLGSMAFPILGKVNFAGLSALDREGRGGWSVGGGIQYNRTELYGLDGAQSAKGVTRSYFPTYVVQAGYGFGVSGFTAHGFIRYGFHPDQASSTLNTGIQFDFNVPMLKKIKTPDSEL